MLAKRSQTQPLVIPTDAGQDKKNEVIRINYNFQLLDKKIEQLWKKIQEMEEPEEAEEQ